MRYVPKTAKVIVLHRNPDAALRSRASRVGKYHFMEPTEIPSPALGISDAFVEKYHKEALELGKAADDYQHVEVHYEELTGNQDARKFPDDLSAVLCGFLMVSNQPLTPKTYKPTVT